MNKIYNFDDELSLSVSGSIWNNGQKLKIGCPILIRVKYFLFWSTQAKGSLKK